MSFGIDFGTTTSGVTYSERWHLDIGNDLPLPSVVAIHKLTGEVIVGAKAKEMRRSLEELDHIVIPSVKRFLGTQQTWQAGGTLWTPEMVATELFRELKRLVTSKAKITENHPLDRAVVAIPVAWSPERRRALREAAAEAGIRIDGFISESTAAFFQCRALLRGYGKIAVFDWGGGTLDISILSINGSRIEEWATEPLERAGDHIDQAIARWAHEQIVGSQGIDVNDVDPAQWDKLVAACEEAKRILSVTHEKSHEIVVGSYAGRGKPRVSLRREVLNELVKPFVDDAADALSKALARAKVSGDSIGAILLVGGSSGLRTLQDRMDSDYPGKIVPAEHPDWAVADGASSLASTPGCYRVMQNVFLKLADETEVPVITHGDKVGGPARSLHLGVVEPVPDACLVFTESLGSSNGHRTTRCVGHLSVPTTQFFDEVIVLRSELTLDLTLVAAATGNKGNQQDTRRWEYEQLRFFYDLPTGRSQ